MSPLEIDGHRVITWETFTRWRRNVIGAYLILSSVLVLSMYLGFSNAREQTHNACQASLSARLTLRGLVVRARAAVEHNPDITPQQRRRAERFYTDALKHIPTTPCP